VQHVCECGRPAVCSVLVPVTWAAWAMSVDPTAEREALPVCRACERAMEPGRPDGDWQRVPLVENADDGCHLCGGPASCGGRCS
jgi:hypothetical protein